MHIQKMRLVFGGPGGPLTMNGNCGAALTFYRAMAKMPLKRNKDFFNVPVSIVLFSYSYIVFFSIQYFSPIL